MARRGSSRASRTLLPPISKNGPKYSFQTCLTHLTVHVIPGGAVAKRMPLKTHGTVGSKCRALRKRPEGGRSSKLWSGHADYAGSGTLFANVTHRYRLLLVPGLCNSYCIRFYLPLQFAGSMFPNKDSFRSSGFVLGSLQYAPVHASVSVCDRLAIAMSNLP